MHIPTLEHHLAQLQRDAESINTSIASTSDVLVKAQEQLTRLRGAQEYLGLATQRARDTLAAAQAAIAPTT